MRPKIPAESHSFWVVYLHRYILRHKIGFHCVFQRLMNDRVIVNNRIRFNGFQLFGIKLLDVPCFQSSQGVAFLAKIRLDYAFHHSFV